jgi:hypothetical protein
VIAEALAAELEALLSERCHALRLEVERCVRHGQSQSHPHDAL